MVIRIFSNMYAQKCVSTCNATMLRDELKTNVAGITVPLRGKIKIFQIANHVNIDIYINMPRVKSCAFSVLIRYHLIEKSQLEIRLFYSASYCYTKTNLL